jgi:O-methyltransferase involved in polyketide biosynthesis
LAEGLLIYLPAAAQHHLFAGIDALSAPGSHVAVEEAVPMDASDLETARAEERAAGNEDQFFSLIYNEQHAPAVEWFGNRGWRGAAVRLTDYFRQIGLPVPSRIPKPRSCSPISAWSAPLKGDPTPGLSVLT